MPLPASAVWPWIALTGPAPRGGADTYDWIENLLGLNMHSVDHVLPEFQLPCHLGDTLGYGSNTDVQPGGSSQRGSSPGAPRTATGSGRS